MNLPGLRNFSVCLLIALFTACASDTTVKDATKQEYVDLKSQLDKGRYSETTVALGTFITDHPYSRYAVQAELLRIFSSYKGGEYILTETLSKRFIERHPRHANIDYAKYMLAMAFYKQRSTAEHDATQNKNAIDAFNRLLKEHPDSSYAKQGASRLQQLYNTLARHELIVGKHYYDQQHYVAASNRFQGIVKRYQTTPAIEEALYYLASSYAKMGLQRNAHEYAVLLKHNFPNSEWSKKAAPFL
jgi:outer membrane protein assembly factor BamD